LNTLIQQAKTICDEDSLDLEISHLKRAFRYNGHTNLRIMHVLAPKQRPQTQKEKPAGISMLPYQQAVSNRSAEYSPNTTLRQFT
jgi:hypothetical protein